MPTIITFAFTLLPRFLACKKLLQLSPEVLTPHGLRGGNVPWFICRFRCYIKIVCLFTYLPSFLYFFLLSSFLIQNTFFITYLLSYSFTSWLIYLLLPELARSVSRRRRPNLNIIFWVHFMLLYILLWMHVCFCCVWFSFLILSQEIGWEECLSNDVFCDEWGIKP